MSPGGGSRSIPVIHPFLIALIPILHILASNPGQARFSDALVPILISLAVALVAFVVLRLVLKNSYTAGLIVSLFLALFFLPGHLVDFLKNFSPAILRYVLFSAVCVILAVCVFILVRYGNRLRKLTRRTQLVVATLFLAGLAWWLSFAFLAAGSPMYLLFSAVCVMLAVGVFLVVKFRDKLRNPTRILNVVTAVLVVLVLINLYTSGTHGYVTIRTDEVRRAAADKDGAVRDPEDLPDIYYIILDAYGSERLLRDQYGYDNSRFIRSLEDRGFFVTDGRSNYNQTYLSLASSLNMTYINYVSAEVGEHSRVMTPLRRMIEDNSLMRFLTSRGYRFSFFGTSYSATSSNRYADVSNVANWTRSEFMLTLLNTTVLRCLRPAFATRESVLCTLADIPLTREKVEGPLFLFAHVPSPHAPYLFDRNGRPVEPGDDPKAMYLEQVMFINKKIIRMVDEIVSSSDRPPVIVIQGDHGPPLDKENPFYYQTENLNALLVPNGADGLYRSMTPVNSFRVILNSIFGMEFSLLQDRTYVSTLDAPYVFDEMRSMPYVK